MNAFRTFRTFGMVGLLTLVAFGLAVSPASAHDKSKHSGSISINFGGGSNKYFGGSSFCKYPSYCGTNYCYYPSYCSYPTYGCFDSLYSCNSTVCYPVIVYDSFGRPMVVWKTGYGSTAMAILR